MKKNIFKIHVDSDKFDPKTLLSILPSESVDMSKCSGILDNSIYNSKYYK